MISLANLIANDESTDIPDDMLETTRDVVAGRELCALWYQTKDKKRKKEAVLSDRGHAFFIRTLRELHDILSSAQKVRKSPHLARTVTRQRRSVRAQRHQAMASRQKANREQASRRQTRTSSTPFKTFSCIVKLESHPRTSSERLLSSWRTRPQPTNQKFTETRGTTKNSWYGVFFRSSATYANTSATSGCSTFQVRRACLPLGSSPMLLSPSYGICDCIIPAPSRT